MVNDRTVAAFMEAAKAHMPDDDAIRAQMRWGNTGIPRRLWGYALAEHLEKYPQDAELGSWVAGYPDQQLLNGHGYPIQRDEYGRGLFLYGPPASGKTTAACALLTSFRKLHQAPVYFTRWDNYLKAKQSLLSSSNADRFEETTEHENTVIGVESFDLVALDDVGHEYSSGSRYGETQLDQVIRSRYDRGLPTIITTNLSEAAWTDRYDATLTSFIKRACAPLAFAGGHGA